jgi:hypothetical protein
MASSTKSLFGAVETSPDSEIDEQADIVSDMTESQDWLFVDPRSTLIFMTFCPPAGADFAI